MGSGKINTLVGINGDVKALYDIVVKGRDTPREYSSLNAKDYHLRNREEKVGEV